MKGDGLQKAHSRCIEALFVRHIKGRREVTQLREMSHSQKKQRIEGDISILIKKVP